nr:hypothetical protein [Pseudescherichia vulneris]
MRYGTGIYADGARLDLTPGMPAMRQSPNRSAAAGRRQTGSTSQRRQTACRQHLRQRLLPAGSPPPSILHPPLRCPARRGSTITPMLPGPAWQSAPRAPAASATAV